VTTEPSEPRIVPYEAGYEEQVVELGLPIWGDDPATSRATLRTRYAGNQSVLLLAVDGGRVVGMSGLMPTTWQRGRRGPVLSTLAWGDTVVAEDHRGSGLLRRLKVASRAQADALGHDSGICAHAGAPVQLALLTLGWRSVGPAERHVRGPGQTTGVARARRAAAHLLRTGRLGRTEPFEALDRVRPGAVRVELAPRVAEMAALHDRITDDSRLRKVRDERLFAGRFGAEPAAHRFLCTGRDGSLDGYVVLETHPGSWTSAVIDWAARDEETLLALLRAVPSSERLELQAMSLTPAERRLLVEAGFRSEPPPARGAFRVLVYGPAFASLGADDFGLRGIDF
jgi:hypothetical protein